MRFYPSDILQFVCQIPDVIPDVSVVASVFLARVLEDPVSRVHCVLAVRHYFHLLWFCLRLSTSRLPLLFELFVVFL